MPQPTPGARQVMLGELITSPVSPWASKATRRRTSLAAFTNISFYIMCEWNG